MAKRLITYDEIKNIVIGKLVDKTITEDYDALSERVFGEGNCFARDEARKRFYGAKAVIDAVERDKESAMKSIDLEELNNKKIELQKERQRMFDQRRELNKIINSDGRWEHLISQLSSSAENLSDTIGILYDKMYDVVDKDSEAVLVLSDWHYGMTTSNIFNVYDTETCIKRVRAAVDNAKERIMLHKCSALHVIGLGDFIHGDCHVSARVASEEVACDQLMQVSEIIAQSIIELSQYVPQTFVYITYGNHARSVQNKHDSIHRDNMERIIPWWLKFRLDVYNNITVWRESENEFIHACVCGHDICAAHGDIDSVKNSTRLIQTLFRKTYGADIEYIILGDKHHRESFEELGITSMICGSLCGADDYANERRLYSTPSQLLLIFDKDGLDAEYRIRCE